MCIVLLLLLLLLFQGREPVAGIGGGVPFLNQQFFLFEFVRLQLRLLPFPHLLLLFTGEEEFGVFLQPVPFCEGGSFLLIGFLDSGILRGYGFLDCGDFFFCQDVDAFQLPVLVFVFRPSFLGGGIYFGTYFGVDTCTGQLFQNIRFFAFLALQELGEVALRQHGGAAELFEGQPHCSLYFRLYLILFVELCAAFLVFQCPAHILHGS